MGVKSLAERIQAWRASRGLDQESFGKLADVSKQTVSGWERGAYEPSSATQERLAQKLGISRQDLLFGDIPEPASAEEVA